VVRELQVCGARAEDLSVIWVPGSFEVPIVLQALAEQKGHDAYIALGAVIEGETSHAQSIIDAVTRSIGDLARVHRVPILDGIVAAPTEEIARVRCLPGPSCRGPYLARAAVEMARVLEQLPHGGIL
jgi:6,7-dimethyl-8-ribityllumazine synthase